MTRTDQPTIRTAHPAPMDNVPPVRSKPAPVDNAPPVRSKVAGVLAAVACAVCCAIPFLIAAGVLTGAGAVIMQQTLLAAAAGLVIAGLGMWWLHRHRSARRAHSAGANSAGGPAGAHNGGANSGGGPAGASSAATGASDCAC